MLVWLHPSLVTADSITSTNILLFQNNFSLAAGTTGFVVLTPEGRDTTHFYPAPDNQGPGWDNWYRQFSPGTVTVGGQSYPENVDAATIDHFISVVQATGTRAHRQDFRLRMVQRIRDVVSSTRSTAPT